MFKKKINYHKYDNKKSFHHHDYVFKKDGNESENENEKYLDSKTCCVSEKSNIIVQEFLCHLPMSILALLISLFFLIFFDGIFSEIIAINIKKNLYLNLFHMSHYIHILFASFASFYAFSNVFLTGKKAILGAFLALINSFLFCTLADMILPTFGTFFLDNNISIHLCLFHFDDMMNAIFFSLFGIFASYCLIHGNKKYASIVAKKVHLGHVWFGCIASLFYVFSQIQINIIFNISLLFIILFFSVVIPCIFSDICIPYFFGLYINKKNLYQDIKIQYN